MSLVDLPLPQLLGITVLASAFSAFVAFLFIVIFKTTRPSEVGKNGIKWASGAENDKKDDSISILNHRLFKFLEACMMSGALSLDGSSDKSILCENYLKLKFGILQAGLYDFFKDTERNDYKGLEQLPSTITTLITEYEAKASKMVTHISRGAICGVPRCFNQKFAKWHQRHAYQSFEDFEHALTSRVYINDRERAFALAGAVFFTLRETIYDAKLTLDSLNGDLDKEFEQMIANSCKED